EMTIDGRLLEDGPAQVELANDSQRAQVEVLVDQLFDHAHRNLLRPEAVDQHRYRLADADGVSDLDLALAGQPGGHDVLGHVAGRVGSGSVDLRWVLAGEAASTVPGVAPVAVDYDLPPGDAAVGPGSAQDEAAGWVDVDDRLAVDLLGGDYHDEGRFPEVMAVAFQLD